MALKDLLYNLPGVRGPTEKKLSFNVKLKWTLIILISFFVMSNVILYGVTQDEESRYEYLAILLGSSFGSLMTLGIGPIVMSSIILQLLIGAQIIKIDVNTEEGKRFHGALQKFLAIVFVLFEAVIYVFMGAIRVSDCLRVVDGVCVMGPPPWPVFAVILQLCVGGILVIFMDEVVQKWGFGSGVSLFIAAGIGWRLFSQLFGFIGPQGEIAAVGNVLAFVQYIIAGESRGMLIAIIPILMTIGLFLLVVFAQSLKVEIPLAYDRIRGYSVKWPLQFFYAGVMPVILVSALAANLQLFASLIENWAGRATFLGGFSGGQPISGLAFWIHHTSIVQIITNPALLRWEIAIQAVGHILFYSFFSVLFAYFWVTTSGTDAKGQAKRIISSGMSMPGFRKDERVLESILSRYVGPLTIMGGLAIGLLASVSNLLGALVGGTAILLVIMILYQLYQNIAQQHAVDMNPALRGFFGA
jgi:preprotein translocase subunit SecY